MKRIMLMLILLMNLFTLSSCVIFSFDFGNKVDFEFKLSDDGTYYIVTNIKNVEIGEVDYGYLTGKISEAVDIKVPDKYNKLPIKEIEFTQFESVVYNINLYIPKTVNRISSRVTNHQHFRSIYYRGTLEDWCKLKFYERDFPSSRNTDYFYLQDKKGKYYIPEEIIIPDEVTRISNYQFSGFQLTKKVEIPDHITTIGKEAFNYCGGRRYFELIMPSSIKYIDYDAFKCSVATYYKGTIEDWCNIKFESCYSNPTMYGNSLHILDENQEWNLVTEVEIPNTLTSIGNFQFAGNWYLTKITIPSSIKEIGIDAFIKCEKIDSVYYEGTLEEWNQIKFGEGKSSPLEYAKHFYVLNNNNEYYEVK